MNPKFRNPLILSIVAAIFLIPVLILTMYIFNSVNWPMLAVTFFIYFAVIFLVFLYYSSFKNK